jgi:hypothetical protein
LHTLQKAVIEDHVNRCGKVDAMPCRQDDEPMAQPQMDLRDAAILWPEYVEWILWMNEVR